MKEELIGIYAVTLFFIFFIFETDKYNNREELKYVEIASVPIFSFVLYRI